MLLFLRNIQPVLHQDDAVVGQRGFKLRTALQKAVILLFGAEAHHVLHPGAVIPTAVEDNDFAPVRKMLDVALPVQLRLLALRGCRKSNQAEDPRADALQDALDETDRCPPRRGPRR